ncbi:hypothetical protein, partial [uncultured Sulfitobacter sp.]|uniref:hypothetical protein n=1 Tax=uncultured Sulfitobacter sp. TaxID=191468 RepID=UPI0025958787
MALRTVAISTKSGISAAILVAALILALLLGLLAEGAAAQEQPARPDLGASALVRTGRGWWGRPPPL